MGRSPKADGAVPQGRWLRSEKPLAFALISAWSRGQRLVLALGPLREMGRSQLESDLISCSAATSVCEKSHCGELALLLHQQKRQHYVELGVFICNAIISAREKCPQMLWALLSLGEQRRS